MAAVVCVGLSQAVISAAITVASTDDTVRVPAGSATWSTPLTITKRVKLIGAGIGQTVLTNTSGSATTHLVRYAPAADAVSTYPLHFRLSGFTFDTNDKGKCVSCSRISSLSKVPSWIRIDHCRFVGAVTSFPTVIETGGPFWGVVDHCELVNEAHCDNLGDNAGDTWEQTYLTPGTADNLYYEDNTIENLLQAPIATGTASAVGATSITLESATGIVAYNIVRITGGNTGVGQARYITSLVGNVATVSAWSTLPTGTVTYDIVRSVASTICSGGQCGRYAYRYNDFVCDQPTGVGSYVPFFDNHGNGDGPTKPGALGVEIYGNKVISTVGGNFLDHRGGKALVFFNKCTGVSSNNAWYSAIKEEVADDIIPEAYRYALDGTPQRVNNTYYWNNRFGVSTFAALLPYLSTNVDLSLAENQNWWEQVESGFDGSVGMGCGPLASRPSVEAMAGKPVGVAYWATDQDCTAVSDNHIGVNPTTPITGTLYKWDGTTWENPGGTPETDIFKPFTPFTYPHPFTS